MEIKTECAIICKAGELCEVQEGILRFQAKLREDRTSELNTERGVTMN